MALTPTCWVATIRSRAAQALLYIVTPFCQLFYLCKSHPFDEPLVFCIRDTFSNAACFTLSLFRHVCFVGSGTQLHASDHSSPGVPPILRFVWLLTSQEYHR